MSARTTPPIRIVPAMSPEPESGTATPPGPDDIDDPAPATVEPVRPTGAARWQAPGLAPSPEVLKMLTAGLGAVVLGGAAGYWLASRHDRGRVRPVREAVSSVKYAIELAPVAFQLLANPLVRSLAIRLLTRQLGRRLAT